MIGIYKITNKINGKVYIGQATNVERRINEHKRKRSLTIDDYINVLGKENFDFDILEECSEEELDQKEQEYIVKYDSKRNGYNIQEGGLNNSVGEGNGRAKLTYEDVIIIRQAYNNHCSQKDIYEKFKDKISFGQFQGVWQGRSWSNVMPEVFTEENKNFYIYEKDKAETKLSLNQVLQYRKFYMNHTAEQTYQEYNKNNPNGLKINTFKKILSGDVRKNSVYNEVPIYKKTIKQWELNGKPVSTIPESWE